MIVDTKGKFRRQQLSIKDLASLMSWRCEKVSKNNNFSNYIKTTMFLKN